MKDLSNVCGVDYSNSKWRKDSKKSWHFILYPDSEYYNPNWIADLEETLLPFCYVLHDKDFWDKDIFYSNDCIDNGLIHKKGDIKHKQGDLKKAHYHVSFYYGNATRFTSALQIMELCGGCRLEPVISREADTRYMTHVDYPDKTQYSTDDVHFLGGYPFWKYYNSDDVDIEKEILKMKDFCELNKVWTTNQFVDYVTKYKPDWWSLYVNKAKVRGIIADYCKNMGYEVRYYMNEGDKGVALADHKMQGRLVKYFKLPLYDKDGNAIRDAEGKLLADKQISAG